MTEGKTGVLLLNLGTPKSTKTSDVRKYLREFLMDYRVIDINPVGRWFLVNCIIAPFRSPKSAAEYKKVWTKDGSPLLTHGIALKEKMQGTLGDNYVVELGMRYQEPSIKTALETFKNKGFNKLIVVPLYPQYASATTGSTIEAVHKEMANWQIIPTVKTVNNFVENDLFSTTFAELGNKHWKSGEYEHIVFSYHGLPERQIKKGSCEEYCKLDKCCNSYHSKNYYCYRAQCFETTRRIASKMGLNESEYTVCFQSRLGRDEWIKPYIDDTLPQLREKGIKKVLAFSPAFVADCLETTVEIGEEYKHQFLEMGGERWQLVESLNTHPLWVECLENIVKNA